MKKSKFTETQIVKAIQEHNGNPNHENSTVINSYHQL